MLKAICLLNEAQEDPQEEEDPIKQNGNVWTFELTSPQPRKPGEAAPSSWTMGGASQEEATSVLDTIKKFF